MIANDVATFKRSRRCWKFPDSSVSSRFEELRCEELQTFAAPQKPLDAADRSFRKLRAAGFFLFVFFVPLPPQRVVRKVRTNENPNSASALHPKQLDDQNFQIKAFRYAPIAVSKSQTWLI